MPPSIENTGVEEAALVLALAAAVLGWFVARRLVGLMGASP